ncbi:MAG: metal ABC transporter substrate-binding protein [Acidobacteriota bacterium]|nr:metal ABC transporter substrate-binding protein [Acidobacteriota bacterium]
MKSFISHSAALLLALAAASPALASPPKVITTTEDLAALAREVGGDKITVESLARGYQDPHFVEPKPSFIIKLHDADLLIVIGRELEIGWLPPLLTQSRNAKIQPGSPGYLDASVDVRILEMPTVQLTRAMGDVHPSGNPHYWLDPDNGRTIAKSIVRALSGIAPADKSYFEQRYADFDRRLADAQKRWDAAMAPYKGTKVVTYHRSWPNFTERFGLDVIGYVEPKPGIPPSPSHTIALIAEMKRQQVKIILVEPYFDLKTPEAIVREAGGKVVVLAPSTGGVKEASDYIKLFDYNINLLTTTFKQVLGR